MREADASGRGKYDKARLAGVMELLANNAFGWKPKKEDVK